MTHWFVHRYFQVLLCITNNSNKRQTFLYTELNDQGVIFLTIQFGIRYLFAHSFKYQAVQFYLDIGPCPVLPLQTGSGATAMRKYSTFSKSLWLKSHDQIV